MRLITSLLLKFTVFLLAGVRSLIDQSKSTHQTIKHHLRVIPLMICPSWRDPLSEGLLRYQSLAVCLLSPHGILTLHLIMEIYCRSFFLLTWRDKQPDESGVMHRLTGTDSTQPTVNMCRQDRISALAVRRCIYLPLTQTHNSTEPQLPRLRSADNTCKRHHSQPLPAHI